MSNVAAFYSIASACAAPLMIVATEASDLVFGINSPASTMAGHYLAAAYPWVLATMTLSLGFNALARAGYHVARNSEQRVASLAQFEQAQCSGPVFRRNAQLFL